MGLSCICNFDYDPDPGQWEYWFNLNTIDFEGLNTSKRKRCCSCNELIDIGSICIKYQRARHPWNEIEARISGVDWENFEEPSIPISDHYHCEKCGEIYLNLIGLGYNCLMPNEDMKKSLKEYHELTGFRKG
ncbi:MAG: hypothetical protein H8D87_15195 [Deltaproteobacteria bacterium]|nr:hypothetical protein [Candidatus Desulfobacula maris]